MAFRGFRSNCVLQIILLVITALVGAGMLVLGRYASLFIVGALLVYQAWSLVRYVEFTNRKLDLFLRSIEFSDFSHRLAPGPAGRSFKDLAARSLKDRPAGPGASRCEKSENSIDLRNRSRLRLVNST
jgi:hypothetical protein